MGKRAKKWFKWIGLIILIPVFLVLLMVGLVYIPFVQNFAVQKITQSLSGSIGMQLNIGDFRLTYPLNLTVRDVYATDTELDTIAYVRELRVNIRPRPLLKKNISVSAFYLNEARIHTRSLIEGIEIQGVVGSLEGFAESVSLINENAIINRLMFADADLSVRFDSIMPSDTIGAKINWKLLLEEIDLERIALSYQQPADSLQVETCFDEISLADVNIDLYEERYEIFRVSLAAAKINVDIGNQTMKTGIDPMHLKLTDVMICADSIIYQPDEIQANIQSFTANEQSGMTITSLAGKIKMDNESVNIPDLRVKTPYSTVSAKVSAPFDITEKNSSGFLSAQLNVVVDKRDMEFFLGEWANTIAGFPAGRALSLSCRVDGNMSKLYLNELHSDWPGVYHIEANGLIQDVLDSISRSGSMSLTASINGKELLAVVPAQYTEQFSLPDTVRFEMQATLLEGTYSADMQLSEMQGKMKLSGHYNPFREEYLLDLQADNIVPMHFLPQDSLLLLTAKLQAEGKGWDVFSEKTATQFSGMLTEMQYKELSLSGITFDGSLKEHRIQGAVTSELPYIKANMTFDGDLQKDRLSGMLILDMDTLDLYEMKISQQPFSNTFQIFSEFDSDLKKRHRLDVTLGNWDMFLSDKIISPKTLILHALTNEDTTQVSLHAGDLGLILAAHTDVATVADQFFVLTDSMSRQLQRDSLIDFQQHLPLFPQLNLRIEAQNDNPVYNYLQNNNTYFDRFHLNASLSPETGLTMDGLLLSLIKDTMKIDTIRLDVRQETTELKYALDVVKNRFRRQAPYQAGLKGSLTYSGGDAELMYRNENGTTGFQVGLRAEKQQDGVNFQVFPRNPVLAYMPFQVNENNFVRVKSLKDISANLRLTGADNTLVWLHSEEDDGKMQELLTEINGIDLNRISTDFLQIPSMKGVADMSIRYVPEENTFMIVADANVNNLVYEGETVGELLLNVVYLPLDNREQQLDIHLFHNQNVVSTLSALYQPAENERIDGSFDIQTLALSTLNPFLSGMAQLNGALHSSITLSGTATQPVLNGYLKLDTASVYSTATGSRFRFDDKQVEVNNNTIRLDRYGIFAAGNNPLLVDGTIGLNINNPLRSMVDLRMSANNMQLLDSRKTSENMVFGRTFIDLQNFTARGPLNSLVMRGNLNLLGNTNMTLIMKESPLTVNDRMDKLVTFSYFRDTIPRRRTLTGERIVRETRSSVEGLDMLLAVRIDPAVRLTVELDDAGTNRIELEGGGDLSYRYTPQEDMTLTGRYALSGGLIRYNMPIISNKTLRIRENSYLDWSGDIMDPFINLKATERIRTSVSTDDRSLRSVNFDAGIDLRQRMENLQLQFTLEALDDANLQSQLTALGPEERSKRAIVMLLTGSYLDEDTNFDMGMALNSFLQAEINNLTGSLLKGVDFNFGMDNNERLGMGGANYSFRFSKRFYNDRLNVVLGGNVTTGNLPNDNNTFINDASVEYRLDPAGSRYAKLFYQRQYESLFEGEITKYGGGLVFRKKIRKLSDLFVFGRRK